MLYKIKWSAVVKLWCQCFTFTNIISCEHHPISSTVVCHWQNILAPIMTVWPSMIFALMCFRMTLLWYISFFLFGPFPTASPPHQQRTNNPMSRSEHFLSFFLFGRQFLLLYFQVLFGYICPDQEMYLSKLQTVFVHSEKGILTSVSFFPHFQIRFSFKDICPNQ